MSRFLYVSRCITLKLFSKKYDFRTIRNVSAQGFRQTTMEKFRINDKIPEKYVMIYRCKFTSYLSMAQISAAIGLIFVAGSYFVNRNENDFNINLSGIDLEDLYDSKFQLFIFSLGFIVINIAVLLLINKLPVRIYFNEDLKKYLAVLYGKVPKTKSIIEFNAGEVLHTPKIGILPWNEFRYKLKNGKTIVLLDHYFRTPDDMNIMLGYTKLQ